MLSLRCVLQRILSVLLPISVALLIYSYLYPVFHGCAFPVPDPNLTSSAPATTAFVNILKEHIGYKYGPVASGDTHGSSAKNAISPPAPFRLLVLADPQIEGDSSLPKPNDGFTDRLWKHWTKIASAKTWEERVLASIKGAKAVVLVDYPRSMDALRKRLDLFGNDYYLAQIYRTLSWWTKPTHVTVLGDLIGSQWVSDTEFNRRTGRYWNKVFKGGVRVDDEITITGGDAYGNGPERIETLPAPSADMQTEWSRRIISLAGNHDVGYAGDITVKRIERFEREFGRHNWDVRFEYAIPSTNASIEKTQQVASLHLIVLDSLLLDTPALSPSLQDQTYKFLNDLISHRSRPVEDRNSFTLLLTHIPLHKEAGVCKDAPHFAFFHADDVSPPNGEPRFKKGGLREQNHISGHLSHVGILQGVFGMSGDPHAPAGGKGRKGLILTGHDHNGCDVVHFVNRTSSGTEKPPEGANAPSWSWSARRYQPDPEVNSSSSQSTPSIREVTLRSMMGEFGGNAGLLSLWFDSNPAVMEWKYDVVTCKMGVQHVWWTVHITAFIALVMTIVWPFLYLAEKVCPSFITGKTTLRTEQVSDEAKPTKGIDEKTKKPS